MLFVFLYHSSKAFFVSFSKNMKCDGCGHVAFVLQPSVQCSCSCQSDAMAWFGLGATLCDQKIWCSTCVRASSEKHITKANRKTLDNRWKKPCVLCLAQIRAGIYNKESKGWDILDLSSVNMQHVEDPPPEPPFLSWQENVQPNFLSSWSAAMYNLPPSPPNDDAVLLQRLDGCEDKQRELLFLIRTKEEHVLALEDKINVLKDMVDALTHRILLLETSDTRDGAMQSFPADFVACEIHDTAVADGTESTGFIDLQSSDCQS